MPSGLLCSQKQDALAQELISLTSNSCNVQAKKIGVYFSVHSLDILTKTAFQKASYRGHLRLNADRGDQREDHCPEPARKDPVCYSCKLVRLIQEMVQ